MKLRVDGETIRDADGLEAAIVTIPVGSTVAWTAMPPPFADGAALVAMIEEPVTRVRSTRDPISDTLGFDSGMLVPGATYKRRFEEAGLFSYSAGDLFTASKESRPRL